MEAMEKFLSLGAIYGSGPKHFNLRNICNIRNCGPKQQPRARDDDDEEAAYESYMNPKPGFQSGPGDSVDAD